METSSLSGPTDGKYHPPNRTNPARRPQHGNCLGQPPDRAVLHTQESAYRNRGSLRRLMKELSPAGRVATCFFYIKTLASKLQVKRNLQIRFFQQKETMFSCHQRRAPRHQSVHCDAFQSKFLRCFSCQYFRRTYLRDE